MKKKTTKKELQDVMVMLISENTKLQQRVASYNTLFSMYVKYKGDSDGFQEFLKKELEDVDAKIGQAKNKED